MRGLEEDFLESLEILHEAFASMIGEMDDGLWTRAGGDFFNSDGFVFLENLEMALEVAVGKAAFLLEFVKAEAVRRRAEGGHDG